MSKPKKKFELEFIEPFSTFVDGKPKAIPYVIQGLLTKTGFSIIGAKPKHGKSTMSRQEAVAIAKGKPFFGRDTECGEVILVSLEDQLGAVDLSLHTMGWDPKKDEKIKIVTKLPKELDDTIEVLGDTLTKMPMVRLVVIDTLAKALRVKELNDYNQVLETTEKFRLLARDFPNIHIQGLLHCKKAETTDPFDSLLGSTALRGETDTSIVIYQKEDRNYVVESEGRLGIHLEPTILTAEMVTAFGTQTVKQFTLGKDYEEYKMEKAESKKAKKDVSMRDRIREYLQTCDGKSVPQEQVLDDVSGNRSAKLEAIQVMVMATEVIRSGKSRSTTDPLHLQLNPNPNNLAAFVEKFNVTGDVQ
ncbi:MAG: AAA family ATPase [Terriglobales bacterium]